MTRMTVAIDLAENVFELAIADPSHEGVQHKRLSRRQLLRFLDSQPPSHLILEACGTSHFWGRLASRDGHKVSVLPAQYVRAYRRRNKTDRADATALLEAARSPDILPVPLKSEEQQSIQQVHRAREQWIRTRTARINHARGILREFGIVLPSGPRHVRQRIPDLIEDADNGLPSAMRDLLSMLLLDIKALDERVCAAERHLHDYAMENLQADRLRQIPGLGLLTTTAIASAVGDIQAFKSGRHFASWAGLTPKEHSSGNRRSLGRISRRGNVYIRTLLIHGGRSVLTSAVRKARAGRSLTPLDAWGMALRHRLGFNKAAVAMANKLARRAYALCRDSSEYRADHRSTVATV